MPKVGPKLKEPTKRQYRDLWRDEARQKAQLQPFTDQVNLPGPGSYFVKKTSRTAKHKGINKSVSRKRRERRKRKKAAEQASPRVEQDGL